MSVVLEPPTVYGPVRRLTTRCAGGTLVAGAQGASDAQLALARSYEASSWARLVAAPRVKAG
jgi:hypothetical protein